MKKPSGLADSPFFSTGSVYRAPSPGAEPVVVERAVPASPLRSVEPVVKPDTPTSSVPESGSSRLPDHQTSRPPDPGSSELPDFQSYTVPDYRKMRRLEVRLTLEQIRFLDDLEWELGRSLPDLEKANPESRRITKNSILRVLVEILRSLGPEIDASNFRNERDLLITLHRLFRERLADTGTSRLPE